MAHDYTYLLSDLAASDGLGEAVVYTSPEGATTSVSNAMIRLGETTSEPRDGHTALVQRATATVLARDLAHAERGGTLTRSATGVEWAVEHATPTAGGAAWELALRRTAAADRTAGHYR